MFSTAFDQVDHWQLNCRSVGEHLRSCPFFRRVRHVAPIQLPLFTSNSTNENDIAAEEEEGDSSSRRPLTAADVVRLTEHAKKVTADLPLASGDEVVELANWRETKPEFRLDLVSRPAPAQDDSWPYAKFLSKFTRPG